MSPDGAAGDPEVGGEAAGADGEEGFEGPAEGVSTPLTAETGNSLVCTLRYSSPEVAACRNASVDWPCRLAKKSAEPNAPLHAARQHSRSAARRGEGAESGQERWEKTGIRTSNSTMSRSTWSLDIPAAFMALLWAGWKSAVGVSAQAGLWCIVVCAGVEVCFLCQCAGLCPSFLVACSMPLTQKTGKHHSGVGCTPRVCCPAGRQAAQARQIPIGTAGH